MEYLLKASAITIIFYVFYNLFLQRDTFFESNRWFLLTGLITTIFIPLYVIPIYVEQTPIDLNQFVIVQSVASTEANNNSFDLIFLLKSIYILGVLVFIFRFIFQLSSLLPLFIKSENHKSGRYKFLKTTKTISPFSFFNYIVYNPNQFNETELEQIITHEKVHVHQYHTLDILFTQLICIAFWFNPFIWLYNKALKQNLEFIADKTAINYAQCKKSYQYTLLKTSVPSRQLALTNNFYNSLIKKRIVMLHKSKSKKINLFKYALIIPVLALFLMSFNTKEVILEKETVPVKTKKNTASVDSSIESLEKQESLKFIITKNTTKDDLDRIIQEANSKGVTLKFKGIKRNSNNEIIAISASFKNNKGSGNYQLNGDEPIQSFAFFQDKNASFGFKGISDDSNLKKQHNMVFVSEDGEKHVLNNSDADGNVFIISTNDDESDDIEVKTIIIKDGDTSKITKKHKVKMIHFNSLEDTTFVTKGDKKVYKITTKYDGDDDNLTWTTKEDGDMLFISKDDNAVKKHKIVKIKTDGNEPLYMIDGKEITKEEMNNINPETIDKVEVLKGDSATEKYGDKGKNGVVLITLKKKN